MRIIVDSQDILCLYLGRQGAISTRCTFDRLKDAVTITDLFWIIPVRQTTLPLSAITEANVQRIGDGGDKRYYLALHLRFGRTVRTARLAKNEALNVLPLVQGFLKVE